MKSIYVIGAGVEGQEGFGSRALELINKAEVLIAGDRQLKLFPDFPGRKIAIGNNLSEIVDQLK